MPIGGKSVGNLMAFLGLDASNFTRGMGSVQGEMRRTTGALKGLASELGYTFGAAGIVLGVGALVKKIYSLGVAQEQINTSFGVFLGSAEKANVLIGELTQFAAITPFTSTEIFQGAKALLAFGFSGDKILPTLKTLGDISAGTGKNLAELSVIYGQIQSAGRLMGQDLLQLINAGFNPLTNISKKTGKSMAMLKKEMEGGAISFEMVEQAFVDATTEGGLFFNMMEKQSKTIGGKMSTVVDNLENIGKGLFAVNSGPLKDLIESLVTITNNVDTIVTGLQWWIKLVSIVPTTTFKIATSMGEVNDAIKTGQIGLMGMTGAVIKTKEKAVGGFRLMTKGMEEINQIYEQYIALQKDAVVTVTPTVQKLDTIAKLETRIKEIKAEATEATVDQLPALGQQLRFYERQKEELEAILTNENKRRLLPSIAAQPGKALPTKITISGNPFATQIAGANSAAKAYAALILQMRNVKDAQDAMAAAEDAVGASMVAAQGKIEKQAFAIMTLGNIMGSAMEEMIASGQSFADGMKSMAIQVVDAVMAVITAILIEKAARSSKGPYDAAIKIAAATVAAGVVKGILRKSLQQGASGGKKAQGLASGGYVTGGGMFQLHKDELVSLPRGSAVTPANMANGGGGNLSTEINLRKFIIELDRERQRMGR